MEGGCCSLSQGSEAGSALRGGAGAADANFSGEQKRRRLHGELVPWISRAIGAWHAETQSHRERNDLRK